MPVYVPTTWSVGQRLKATALNVVVNAITELQAGAARIYYGPPTRTGLVATSASGETDFGAWSSPTFGFSVSGNGIAVASAGVYGITVTWYATYFTSETYLEIIAPTGTTASRTSVPGSATTDFLTTTTIVALNANDVITPARKTAMTTITGNVTMRIVRLAI